MSEEMQRILDEVKAARATGTERRDLWKKSHDLAEAGYLPAAEFFRSYLDDPDWDWRLEGVDFLGFHFLFGLESETLEKIKQLLLTDPNEFVRMAAATALGSQLRREIGESKSSVELNRFHRALLEAMQSDSKQSVRYAALESLLLALGVPYPIAREEVGHAKKIGTLPSLSETEQILRRAGIADWRLSV